VRSALYDDKALISDFIVGLGGTRTGLKTFLEIYQKMSKDKKSKKYWLL